jgi:hypothetical protein
VGVVERLGDDQDDAGLAEREGAGGALRAGTAFGGGADLEAVAVDERRRGGLGVGDVQLDVADAQDGGGVRSVMSFSSRSVRERREG